MAAENKSRFLSPAFALPNLSLKHSEFGAKFNALKRELLEFVTENLKSFLNGR